MQSGPTSLFHHPEPGGTRFLSCDQNAYFLKTTFAFRGRVWAFRGQCRRTIYGLWIWSIQCRLSVLTLKLVADFGLCFGAKLLERNESTMSLA